MTSHSRLKTIALFSLVSGIIAMLVVFFVCAMADKTPIEIATFSILAYLVMCLLGLLLGAYVTAIMPVRENPSFLEEPLPPLVDLVQMPEMPPLPPRPTPAQDLAKPEGQLAPGEHAPGA